MTDRSVLYGDVEGGNCTESRRKRMEGEHTLFLRAKDLLQRKVIVRRSDSKFDLHRTLMRLELSHCMGVPTALLE